MAGSTFPIPGSFEAAPRRWSQAAILEWLNSWIVTVDHKKLGILYWVFSIFFLLVGGAEALAIRIQLAVPDNHFLSPQVYNRMFTMHGDEVSCDASDPKFDGHDRLRRARRLVCKQKAPQHLCCPAFSHFKGHLGKHHS